MTDEKTPVVATSDKKNATWMLVDNKLTVTFPDKSSQSFDMVEPSSPSGKAFLYYGMKQWLSDNVASEKSINDKLVGMKLAYDEMMEFGLEITETGKIRIVGKVRANAAPKYASLEELKATGIEKNQKPVKPETLMEYMKWYTEEMNKANKTK